MKNQIKRLIKIAVAVLLLAISINMFLGPHHIAAGGVSGIGILLEQVLYVNRSWIVLGFNLILLLFAAIYLGKKTFLNTVFGSILFPIFLGIVPEITLTSDRLLSVVFGSVIFAIGVASLYKLQASSGGTTIPPLIFERYFGLNTSIGLLLTDASIVFLSLFVFGMEEFLFAILSIGITSIVMNYIETGLNRKKVLMITSLNNLPRIKSRLKKEVELDLAIIDIRSGNDNVDQEMFMIVVDDKGYPHVRKIIDQIDPECFVITYNVAEVHGKGFSYHPIQ